MRIVFIFFLSCSSINLINFVSSCFLRSKNSIKIYFMYKEIYFLKYNKEKKKKLYLFFLSSFAI